MDILLIGSGGREHAICRTLAKSKLAGKIYCAPGHWGDGGENIVVIGKHRGSPKYIEIIIPRKHIENFRCQKIFKPAVLKLMDASKWGFWDNSDDHRDTITKMAEGLNSGRFD